MKNRSYFIALMVLAVCLGLTICGWAQSSKTMQIAIATPLTGPAANVGDNFKNAVILAVKHQNAQGGVTIGGQKYMLETIIRDTKLDPAVAKAVAEELVYDKKVKAIFGPTQVEVPAMQTVTEPNKVLLFGMSPVKGMVGPDKPFSYFLGGYSEEMYVPLAIRSAKVYPKAKRVVSTYVDFPDAIIWEEAAKNTCSRYGLEWLGMEKYPVTTVDFSPIVDKLLEKKPDIVDASGSGGAMGAVLPLYVKQLRQAGFEGIIWMPAAPPSWVMEEAVPKQYLSKIIVADTDFDSPIIPKTYKDLHAEYIAQFKSRPIDALAPFYDGTKGFLEFLNTQKTMDTTAWAKGFEQFRWKGVCIPQRWLGKPIYGSNRFLVSYIHVSEWVDGKLRSFATENFPWELYSGT